MTLSDGSKREYSAEELAVLGGVIDYAERMIYEDKNLDVLGGMADSRGYVATTQAPAYRLLRKNAYAKTVVIQTELSGRVMLRLSPTEDATYPNSSSGYCTPHSAQGRLASFVQPGYESRSKVWGDYRVVEVRSFERFGGPEFEPNVRNFLRMAVIGDDIGKSVVQDLFGFLERLRRSKAPIKPSKPVDEVAEKRSAPVDLRPSEIAPVAPAVADVLIFKFAVVEDAEEEQLEVEADSDEEWNPDSPPVKLEEYYGLSERFFTHQTAEQNQIISRSPVGPMFVEGIAGSGKTSAALGRTKMLTTFNARSVTDEKMFYDLLGQGQDYWSAEFAGQFSQESCIGFVRTGELIQYLQETCRRIDLPDLPVHEFKELQTRLRDHRKLTHTRVPGRRWVGLSEKREAHEATTMAWLRASDQAMARRLADLILDTLPTLSDLSAPFVATDRVKVDRVMAPALEHLRHQLGVLVEELLDPPREGAFSLDRLALRLENVLVEVRKRVMGSKVVWTQIDGKTHFANDENSLARLLVDQKAALYLRTGERLVFADGNGPIDASLQLRTAIGEPVAWTDDAKALLATGQVIVRDAAGNHVRGVASDVNYLFLRLLPEATDRIYVLSAGSLRRLPIEHGWGRLKLNMVPIEATKLDDDETEEETEGIAESTVPGQPRRSTSDAIFTRLVRRQLLRPLTALPDLYLEVLKSGAKHFPSSKDARQILKQLQQFKLADEDIDLLLCIGHLLSRGMKQGGVAALREAAFYQAVFVDEVQDFTEQQVYLMVEQANPRYRAITVVGDVAQKLHHGSSIDLRACFAGQSVANVKLSENLRQTDAPGLALFSAMFRSQFYGDAVLFQALLNSAHTDGLELVGPKVVTCSTARKLDEAIVEALKATKRSQTLAVLFPNAETASATFKRLEVQLREQLIDAELSEKVNLSRRHVRHFADVANAKGLEFDVVVMANVESFDLSKASHVNRLYVGVTRARRALTLLSRTTPVSKQLTQLMNDFDTQLSATGARPE